LGGGGGSYEVRDEEGRSAVNDQKGEVQHGVMEEKKRRNTHEQISPAILKVGGESYRSLLELRLK
jgi:hypothetical protein